MSEETTAIESEERFNPFLNSLMKPRDTIRYVVNNDATMNFWLLIYFVGLSASLDNIARRDDYSFDMIVIVLLLIFAPISGLIQVYFSAWVFSWFGRVFGGAANSEGLRASILWSSVPAIFILPISLITTIIGATNMVSLNALIHTHVILFALYWLLLIVELIIGIWCFVNLVRMISEVQEFSAGKAFLSIVLPGLILLVVVLIIVFLIR